MVCFRKTVIMNSFFSFKYVITTMLNMKKIVLSLILVLATGISMAQSQFVATLVHNGEVSTYYGFNAFVDAYTAADNGDIITLSSGTFRSTNISKGLTVRGAGFVDDSESQTNSTVITGDFSIILADSLRLSFEGILFNDDVSLTNLSNSQFLKCYFNYLSNVSGSKAINNTFYHCYIKNPSLLGENSFISCVVKFNNSSKNCSYTFDNCILIANSTSSSVYYSTCRNCIFIQRSGSYFSSIYPSSGGLAFNCISNKYATYDIFSAQTNNTNQVVSVPISSIFKTYDGQGIPLEERFELTDSAAAVFLGSDGTQVGIYGGPFPFSPTPSYPRITKFEVSNKTDAEGKLRMKLEVKSGN